ncbi:CLUMA_CG016624, isoform A [Clunio marinus]|uniref:CLUMA_CG016624, isoform A n=1 Tax=Clunio marinus TaxID=568069 RepID=A0A1J1ISF9_9DIPT|nr:CLUMA_CG016624, isoform A [Clunio marinus]
MLMITKILRWRNVERAQCTLQQNTIKTESIIIISIYPHEQSSYIYCIWEKQSIQQFLHSVALDEKQKKRLRDIVSDYLEIRRTSNQSNVQRVYVDIQ